MTEPRWLVIARTYLGQREVPGPASSPWIRQTWEKLRGGRWFWNHFGQDDSRLPWCGAFTARVMDESGIDYPQRYASALAWADWGVRLGRPALGAVVVYRRSGGGHVGFVVGVDQRGNVLTLGGNQNDQVSIAPFDRSRVVAYRFPPGQMADWPHLVDVDAPLIASNAPVSRNEA